MKGEGGGGEGVVELSVGVDRSDVERAGGYDDVEGF